ncbi:MAG: glycosyltransferase [Oscillospiraceae bacterium]|jgi:glycosyltransferase involved in cell wall biosynthesis|nr:glycosyltransferase [Oscillospiraceae bacterium]
MDNGSPRVSVIIPVYNTEKYLRKCLDSIIDQSFDDYEIICVDDGATDGSSDILAEYKARTPNMLVIRQENQGLSGARNTGIEAARGEYICFIDSDDFVKRGYIGGLLSAAICENADIAIGRYYIRLPSGAVFPAPGVKLHSADAKDALQRTRTYMNPYAWCKVYKRSLFMDTGIRYPKMKYEDLSTFIRLLGSAKKVAVTDKYLYYYNRRPGSITAGRDVRGIEDMVASLVAVRCFLEEKGDYERFRRSYHYFLSFMMATLINRLCFRTYYHSGMRVMMRSRSNLAKTVRFLKSDKIVYDRLTPEMQEKIDRING